MSNKEKAGKPVHGDAQDLLQRLNAHFDSQLVDTEKDAMKNLDKFDETDVLDTDTAHGDGDDIPKLKLESTKRKEDGVLTDDELQKLREKLLGGEKPRNAAVTYDDIHTQILNAEIRSGMEPQIKPDVEKNIDEAEKYVDSITEQAKEQKVKLAESPLVEMETENFGAKIENAEDLSAYEPKEPEVKEPEAEETPIADALSDFKDDPMEDTAEETTPADTAETTGADMPTDTAMMKAFGLNPKREVTRDTPLFEDLAMGDDMASTEEISQREMGETVEEPIIKEDLPKEPEEGPFEYRDSKQKKTVLETFKSKYKFSKTRLILAGALAVLLGLLENIPGMADLFGGMQNLIYIDFLLTFLAAALVFDRLVVAVKSFKQFRLNTDVITLVAFFLSFVTTICDIFLVSNYDTVLLYNFPFALCVFLNTLSVFITIRRDVYSFNIVSSGKTMRVLTRTEGSAAAETEDGIALPDYLNGETDLATIQKTNFVSDFFAHRAEPVKSKFVLRILLPECLAFSVLFFFLSYFVAENSLAVSFGAAYATFMMAAPFMAFLSFAYPLYLASRRAYTYHSAILSDKSSENYEKTGAVSFRDEDAFPVGKTKVKSLKLYGDRHIESVLYYASSVYSKVGGPLETVFKQATLNSVTSENVELTDLSDDGVTATVDGKTIVIGKSSYMVEQCFEPELDTGDESYEGTSSIRILYLACEEQILAKFYIKYATTSDFHRTVKNLAKEGVATSIHTADPGIDSGILQASKLNPAEYPVTVIKKKLPVEKETTVSALSCGVVSIGSPRDTVRTFLLCKKLVKVKKTEMILKLLSSILGITVMALVLFLGNIGAFLSVFPVLFQLFWLIPAWLTAKSSL